MPTILLWRLGALGDTLLAVPALAALRASFPDDRMVVAGQPAAWAPALWSGLADEVRDAARPELAPLLSGHSPAPGVLPDGVRLAVVWSAHHDAIARGLTHGGVAHVIGAPALPAGRTSVATHCLETLAPLGIMAVPVRLQAPSSAHDVTSRAWQQATGTRPAARDRAPVVLFHPGAGSRFKRWPLRHYLMLARDLRSDGIGVVWTAGPADDGVRAALGEAGEKEHVLPPCDVTGLATLLERADVVVSTDCGVAHLAALLAVPAITLFGPTDPVIWGPPSASTLVVSLALPCAPCGDLMRHCPTRMCLRGLSVERVHAAVRRQLHRTAGAGVAQPVTNARRSRHVAPSPPEWFHSRARVPGPPGLLRVGRWDNGRRWVVQPSTATAESQENDHACGW